MQSCNARNLFVPNVLGRLVRKNWPKALPNCRQTPRNFQNLTVEARNPRKIFSVSFCLCPLLTKIVIPGYHSMGKGKRKYAVVNSSSDDDEEKDEDFSRKPRCTLSKSAPTRKNRKMERVSPSRSYSRRRKKSSFSDFDEVKRVCAEFDQGLSQLKVTSGSRSNKDLWVDKYKPCCLQDLAVHKKKVEQVKKWFEERLKGSVDASPSNVILISGQAGFGKSATIYAIACHLRAEVHEWKTPIPTIWHEHLHNSNSGLQYMSKLDQFESYIDRISRYGLVSLSLTQVSPSPVILLIDDLPVVNSKISYGRLLRCLHILLRSARLPTAILFNDYGRCESQERYRRYLEELQLSLQNAGAFKVTFNPVTGISIKKVLSKICEQERFEVSNEQIDLIAKACGGDIRQAITSLQYFSLALHPMHSTSIPAKLPAFQEEKGNESGQSYTGASLTVGKDETLSLFHGLGKFLHNKRQSESSGLSDIGAILLKEKFIRHPLQMDAPELVLSQAHGEARLVADFLHENVLDFVSSDAIEDAWVVSTYLSATDLLLAPYIATSKRKFEVEDFVQSAAASVAVRGVLFGNSCPVSSRWHAIRRPVLWQVEQSLWRNKLESQLSQTGGVPHMNMSSSSLSVIATEFKPSLRWLGQRLPGVTRVHVLNRDDSVEDEYHPMRSSDEENGTDDDEIEDW